MSHLPSEYPKEYIENYVEQIYKFDCHQYVEQSAIYSDIYFHAKGENRPGIILTPQCDIQKYTPENYILLAQLSPVVEIFLEWLVDKKKYSEDEVFGKITMDKNKPKRKGTIKEFVNEFLHNEKNSYFFLPGINGKFTHSFVCCDITECILIKDLNGKNKICVLRSPFREAIPSHFTSYICRVGIPRFKDDFLNDIVDQICRLRDP